MDLNALLASPVALPSIPRVVALALSELQAEEPDLLRVSTILAHEPVLTARLLQLANSARFQLSRRIGTVNEALAILGLRQVRDMVLEAAVISAFRRVGTVDMQQFWRYSLNTAKLAQRLTGARRVAVAPFTAGLLHALGELVMVRGMPELMAQLDAQVPVFAPERAAAEHARLGYSYAQVGAGFARAWNLPDALAEALQHQDAPFERESYEPMAAILHVAAWRCRAYEMGYDERRLADSFPDRAAWAVDLDLGVVLQHAPIAWTTGQEVQLYVA
ncbi:MAG: HDOD domain-containing protein [Hylemonella sp.]